MDAKLEQKARELLAAELERDGYYAYATDVRENRASAPDRLALRAIARALTQQGGGVEGEAKKPNPNIFTNGGFYPSSRAIGGDQAVPKKATMEMLQAGWGSVYRLDTTRGLLAAMQAWTDLLATTPMPEATRPTPSEEDVEAAAKAMWECEVRGPWDVFGLEDSKNRYRRMARAALAASRGEGGGT